MSTGSHFTSRPVSPGPPDPLAEPTKEIAIAVDLQLLRWQPKALRYRLVAEHDQAR